MPDTALVPTHAPEALQLVALVEDHDSVDDCPAVIEAGDAPRVSVGAGLGGGVDPAGTSATSSMAIVPLRVSK